MICEMKRGWLWEQNNGIKRHVIAYCRTMKIKDNKIGSQKVFLS
jgi:hypothetical protein